MALQEYWVGSVGPFYFDDADLYPGTAITMKGIHSTGTIYGDRVQSGTAPVAPIDCVRLIDLIGAALAASFTDATGARAKNVTYQNGPNTLLVVQVSFTLSA